MGTICILLGAIFLIGFTGFGFFASNAILSNQFYMSMLAVKEVSTVYIVVVGVCFLVGLLICMSLVMNGLIYNRVSKNNAMLKRITRH